MSKAGKRSRCPQCGSLDVLKWGTQQSKQRYKCRECGRVFTPLRGDVSLSNRFPLFRKWVLGKRSLTELSRECGHSERQLRRWFDEFLDKPPKWTIRRNQGISVLIDDTWFGKRCLIVYRGQTNGSTLHYRFSDREDSLEISKDLETFKEMGLRIKSFTTDGSEEIIQAIRMSYPHVRMRQAYVMLNKAKTNMFRFIDHPEVQKDTNGIEGFFSHLKDNLRIHRGLSLEHRENFIKWYLFFTNERRRDG